MQRAAAIILAAGKSTRMKSDLPKVLHDICGKPMLWYVLEACRAGGIERLAVVVGHGKDQVIEAFRDYPNVVWVEQREQLGTAHAALMCDKVLSGWEGPIVCIAGDMPLIHGETVCKILGENARAGHAVSLATAVLDDPEGYGRIVRDERGALAAVVEHQDCTPAQRAIREVNISYYCFAGAKMFDLLRRIENRNAKGEYYITDAIHLALSGGQGAGAIAAVPPEDAMGINSRRDLAVVARVMQDRIQNGWMEQGVTIVDPGSTWIEAGAMIGPDATIRPFTYVQSGAAIARGQGVGPHAMISADGVCACSGASAAGHCAGGCS